MKTKKNQYPSYNQHQLKVVCDKLCEKIEELLDVLGLQDIKTNGKMLVGNCPIHDGDNKTAFNLYPEGDYYRGNWKCRTHNCDKIFKGSIIGFVRGVLSNKKYNWTQEGDQTVSFEETIKFIEKFLGNNTKDINISNIEIDKKRFLSLIKNINNAEQKKPKTKISRKNVQKSLIYPCEYFKNRGFSETILNKYDIGLCHNPKKEMYNRAVVPIYDQEYKYMVGCSGRSIFDKCEQCKAYHSTEDGCPTDDKKWQYSKWRHNYGFLTQHHLYNIWFAKKFIIEYGSVILVESPGNVWKLEEAGIHNSVAIFGSTLSDRQKILLDGSGAMTIITIMDNDEAGKKAAKNIHDKCKNTYNIKNIEISASDIGDMSIEEINQQIKAIL